MHSDTWKCATGGNITCTNMKKTWQNEHGITIAKYRNRNSIYIVTLAINDKTISIRTWKT